jgi:hypothetical protein
MVFLESIATALRARIGASKHSSNWSDLEEGFRWVIRSARTEADKILRLGFTRGCHERTTNKHEALSS